MTDEEFLQKLASLEEKIDAIDDRTKKIRRTQLIRSVVTILFFVLPLVALLFSIPFLIDFFEAYGEVLP